MDGPQTGRECSQLNALHATLFDKGDRILKIIVCVLRAVGRKNSARRHGLAVNGIYDAKFISADFNQRHFSDYPFERILNKMQAWLEDVRLDSDFAFRCHNSS